MLCGDFMKEYINRYIRGNFKKIYMIAAAIFIGLIVGIFIYNFSGMENKESICATIKDTLDITRQENFQGINVIKNGMISNLLICFIIYFSSITLVCPYIVIIINFIKGMSIGVYLSSIFAIFGVGNGILTIFLLIILPNIIYIPVFIYLSTNSINFHNEIIKVESRGNKLSLLIKESIYLFITFSIMSLSTIIEQLCSMGVINIYKSL